MAKDVYQIPPRTRVELLHSNIWWGEGVEFFQKGFTNTKGLRLYEQGIRCVGDIWDENERDFFTWEQTQGKFKLIVGEREDWTELTNKISEQWRHLLESDDGPALPGQWLGLYERGEEDPTVVFRCDKDFTPECIQWYSVTLPFPIQCYTVGKHSRCLRLWEHPLGEIQGYFHKVKTVHTQRGPVVDGEKIEFIFFYGKKATLGWDPDRWRWGDGSRFLEYTTKEGKEYISSKLPSTTRAAEKWQGYLPGNYCFYWSQVWDPLRTGKEAVCLWSIWHKAVAVNEWRARIAPASISKQCIFCLPNTTESVQPGLIFAPVTACHMSNFRQILPQLVTRQKNVKLNLSKDRKLLKCPSNDRTRSEMTCHKSLHSSTRFPPDHRNKAG